jgi:hypothetical protein
MAVHCCTRTARPRPVSRCFPREAGAGRRVTAAHHRPTGSGTAARRRLAAPVGLPPGRARLLPTPPARAVPRHFSAEAVALVVTAAHFAPGPPGSRHSRANRAEGLIRGGGPYAVRRSGGLGLPALARCGRREGSLVKPAAAWPRRASARP